MRFIHAFALIYAVAVFLTSCGGRSSKYTLKIGGIGAHATKGTDIRITAKIMQGGKTVVKGSVASSKVSLEISCNQNKITEQKNKQAAAGEVAFDAVRVQGNNFTGNCILKLNANIGGKAVSVTHAFKITAKPIINLPPSTSDGSIPITDNSAVIGRPFALAASGKLKIQPDELCNGSLVLVYHDAQADTVREVNTGGESIMPVDGKVSGLALVKVGGDIADCKAPNSNADPSIVISVVPSHPAGLRLKISEASDSPALNATVADASGRVALKSPTPASGFDNGASIFFNASKANRWTKHNRAVNWSSAVNIVSDLSYPSDGTGETPAKALIIVKPHGERESDHFLYYQD